MIRTKRIGFTLIELLTVVAIISLLISILLPSLSRARDQAKVVKVRAELKGVESALEMFNNDFRDYPDSRARIDPIQDIPESPTLDAPLNDVLLSGAHWLARAMIGCDLQGIDSQGLSLRDGSVDNNKVDYPALGERKSTYFSDKKSFVRDDDPKSNWLYKGDATDYVATKRVVFVDTSFNTPILYYKSNSRATNAFCYDGLGVDDPGKFHDRSGVYRQSDNAAITGWGDEVLGWDFAGAATRHPLSTFGSLTEPASVPISFVYQLMDQSVWRFGTVRPFNPEGYLLISAGKDGLYGTSDDISNVNK